MWHSAEQKDKYTHTSGSSSTVQAIENAENSNQVGQNAELKFKDDDEI